MAEVAVPYYVDELPDGTRRVTVFAWASRTRREVSRIIPADVDPWEAMADLIKLPSCVPPVKGCCRPPEPDAVKTNDRATWYVGPGPGARPRARARHPEGQLYEDGGPAPLVLVEVTTRQASQHRWHERIEVSARYLSLRHRAGEGR